MSGGCDHERSDEERALDRLRAEVRRLTAEVERLSRSEAACVREALEQVGVARAERDEARAEIARLNAELAKLGALKSAEIAPVIERFMAAFGADMPQAPSGTTEPLRRGLMLRKVVRGSVEIGVVLGPAKLTPEAVDMLIGWVTDPGVGGIATLRFSQIERGIWRVASVQDAALARVNLAVPDRDRTGRTLIAVDAVVLTGPLGEPLSPPIAQPWDEEAQRIVDTMPDGSASRFAGKIACVHCGRGVEIPLATRGEQEDHWLEEGQRLTCAACGGANVVGVGDDEDASFRGCEDEHCAACAHMTEDRAT